MRTLALMSVRIPLPRRPQKKLVKKLQTAMRLQLKLKMKMQTMWSRKLSILRLRKQKILLIKVKTRLLPTLQMKIKVRIRRPLKNPRPQQMQRKLKQLNPNHRALMTSSRSSPSHKHKPLQDLYQAASLPLKLKFNLRPIATAQLIILPSTSSTSLTQARSPKK